MTVRECGHELTKGQKLAIYKRKERGMTVADMADMALARGTVRTKKEMTKYRGGVMGGIMSTGGLELKKPGYWLGNSYSRAEPTDNID